MLELEHEPLAEARVLLRGAIANGAKMLPEDTIREAIEIVRDKTEHFDLEAFYKTQGEGVEIYEGEPEERIVATCPL